MRKLATKTYAKIRRNREKKEKIHYWKKGKLRREKRMTVVK